MLIILLFMVIIINAFLLHRSKSWVAVVVFLSISVFSSCRENHTKEIQYPDISGVEVDVKIQRIDQHLRGVSSIKTLDSLLRSERIIANNFVKIPEYPNPGIPIRQFYDMLTNPYIDSLYMEVDRIFGNLDDLESEFELAFRHVKYYYPEFKIPKIKTVITGLSHDDNDIYFSDSLIVIGLDFYLGESGKYRPQYPEYIARRYGKEYIVPQCLMLISNQYNANNTADQTALSDMIYYGKAYYFTRLNFPGISDTLITGYSGEENLDIMENEPFIWAGLLQNEALYETSHVIKEKFLGERPKTYEINESCPGRIGRWVGYRIIQEYMQKSPDETLVTLMEEEDALKIFNTSKYRPSR